MPQEHILQVTESVFSGAVHTTALSKQPEAQQKIYNEIQQVLQCDKQQLTTSSFVTCHMSKPS